jgi:nucleoid DNA-binding protein
MTKRELVSRISQETGLPCVKVAEVLEKTFGIIIDALARHDVVELRGFGVFEVCYRKARVGRNPIRPAQEFPIPARYSPKFKPGKEMKSSVRALAPGTTVVSPAGGAAAMASPPADPGKPN